MRFGFYITDWTIGMGKNSTAVTEIQIAEQYRYMELVRRLFPERERFVFMQTFGCQQNEADSERLCGMAESMGYTVTGDPEQADLIIVNTCAVREHAELKTLSIAGQYKHIKEKNPDVVLLDLIMPKMDGLTVMDRINHDKTVSKHPYFIVITAVGPGRDGLQRSY